MIKLSIKRQDLAPPRWIWVRVLSGSSELEFPDDKAFWRPLKMPRILWRNGSLSCPIAFETFVRLAVDQPGEALNFV